MPGRHKRGPPLNAGAAGATTPAAAHVSRSSSDKRSDDDKRTLSDGGSPRNPVATSLIAWCAERKPKDEAWHVFRNFDGQLRVQGVARA